jgi:branched-chain amino acid transport system ATP-binding protein
MLTSPANTAERPAAYLTVESLSAGYGGTPVIQRISLRVGRGEIVAIVGPNGAGKSTLLKALAGMIPTLSGSVALDGSDITGLRTEKLARRGVGYIPQTEEVFSTLTVVENLEMGGYHVPPTVLRDRKNEVVELFPALGRMLRRRAGDLSGGERKMLAIARALMAHPTVLLLDEPTASLSDEAARVVLSEHVKLLASRGTAVAVVEQKARAALEASDWAYVLAGGLVSASARSADILARPDVGDVFLGRPLLSPSVT